LLAKAVLPLVLLFILSACGGATHRKADSTRILRGTGFKFSVPAGWRTTSAAGVVAARRGSAAVSVRTFTLIKRYDPARFAAAARELDGIAAKLASEAGTKLADSRTTVVGGEKIRTYTYGATKIGFYLVGRREYQLLCRLGPGGADKDGACALLFASFSAA
jgi:hypothetical protein